MQKFKFITGIISNVIKYGGIVYLVIETLQFFMNGLENLENPKKDKDVITEQS